MNGNLGAGTSIRITEGLALIVGEIADTKAHSHHAVQLSIALEGEFLLEWASGACEASVAIIGSDRRHRLSGPSVRQATLLAEPESPIGHGVKDWLAGRAHVAATDAAPESARAILRTGGGGRTLADTASETLAALGIPSCAHGPADPRVLEALAVLKASRGGEITLSTLADTVGISGSRLQHLFKESTGISIKGFLLWKRLLDAVEEMSARRDFTFSALEAGFFDSAHLSRTFKSMLGLKASEVFKDSGSVQVVRE